MLIRSLAINSLVDPGFEYCSREIAKLFYGEKMFDDFRNSLGDRFGQPVVVSPSPARSKNGREEILADSE